MAAIITGIRIPSDLWEQMRLDAKTRYPVEACGLLAGSVLDGICYASQIFVMENVLRSQVRFRIEPIEQLRTFNRIEALGLELVSIYHSHPQGPDVPSETDITEAYYPEAAYLIWTGVGGVWRCRAFMIEKGIVREIEILKT